MGRRSSVSSTAEDLPSDAAVVNVAAGNSALSSTEPSIQTSGSCVIGVVGVEDVTPASKKLRRANSFFSENPSWVIKGTMKDRGRMSPWYQYFGVLFVSREQAERDDHTLLLCLLCGPGPVFHLHHADNLRRHVKVSHPAEFALSPTAETIVRRFSFKYPSKFLSSRGIPRLETFAIGAASTSLTAEPEPRAQSGSGVSGRDRAANRLEVSVGGASPRTRGNLSNSVANDNAHVNDVIVLPTADSSDSEGTSRRGSANVLVDSELSSDVPVNSTSSSVGGRRASPRSDLRASASGAAALVPREGAARRQPRLRQQQIMWADNAEILAKFRRWIVEFIVAKNLAFAVADYPWWGLAKLFGYSGLDPGGADRMVATELPLLYSEEVLTVTSLLAGSFRVSLTADGWKGGTGDNFVGLTAHFIGEDFVLRRLPLSAINCKVTNGSTASEIQDLVMKMLQKFDLAGGLRWSDSTVEPGPRRVFALVTDDGANFRMLGSLLGIASSFCFCHAVNNVVLDGVTGSADSWFSLFGELEEFFHRAEHRKTLVHFCTANREPATLLVKDVPHRWNSKLMLSRSACDHWYGMRNALDHFATSSTCKSHVRDWANDLRDRMSLISRDDVVSLVDALEDFEKFSAAQSREKNVR